MFASRYFVRTGSALLLTLLSVPAAFAGGATAFDTGNSSLVLTHTADKAAAIPQTFSVNVPGPSVPAAPTVGFQINHTFNAVTGSGSSSTVSDATGYEITNLLNLGLALQAGSGVTQTNVPGHAYTGASVTDIAITAVWDLGPSGFPAPGHFPGVSYQYPIGGTVGIAGTDEFKVNLTFTDPSVGPNSIGNISVDKVYPNITASPLAFTDNIAGTILINGGAPLPAGSQLQMIGTIDFLATNQDSPSSIALTDDGSSGLIDASAETVIPEPASATIALIAGAGLLRRRRRR
jgi:hypothetical protein